MGLNNVGDAVFMPGKLILSGEHSVVYGEMAIVTSINLGVKVKVKTRQLRNVKQYVGDDKGLVQKAIELAGGKDLVEVVIKSNLPIGLGLGSSATIAAGVIKAVRQFLKNPIDNQELFDLTMVCEKIAHGNPSGVDPMAVITGGLISFVKGEEIEVVKKKKNWQLKMLVVNTGKPKESTKEMVDWVSNLGTKKDRIIREIGRVTKKIQQALVNGNEIDILINQNGLWLERLGVVSKRVKKISQELRVLNYGVKISGAGGRAINSGIMMVVGKNLDRAKNLLKNKNLDYFEIKI